MKHPIVTVRERHSDNLDNFSGSLSVPGFLEPSRNLLSFQLT